MQMQTYIKPDFDPFSKREAFFNNLHKSYDNNVEVITIRSIENVPEIDMLDDICEIEKNSAHKNRVYPFVRKIGDDTIIDLYLFSADEAGVSYTERCILKVGARLEDSLETEYLSFVYAGFTVDPFLYRMFEKEVQTKFSGIHWNKYDPEAAGEMRCAFLHLYFTLFKSGILELLYKAEFPQLAVEVPEMENIDMQATKPENIFHVPLRLLYLVEDAAKTNGYLFDKFMDNREFVKKIYFNYTELFQAEMPCLYQWEYLEKISELQLTIDRNIYYLLQNLKKSESNKVFAYIEFQEKRYSLREYFPWSGIPKIEEIDAVARMLRNVWLFRGQEDRIQKHLLHAIKSRQLITYEDKEMITVMPTSFKEISREAAQQKNCLMRSDEYIQRILEDDCCLVFIRKKSDLKKSFITVEISGNKVIQAYKSYNRWLSIVEDRFLCEFARKNNLLMFARKLDYENNIVYNLNDEMCYWE